MFTMAILKIFKNAFIAYFFLINEIDTIDRISEYQLYGYNVFIDLFKKHVTFHHLNLHLLISIFALKHLFPIYFLCLSLNFFLICSQLCIIQLSLNHKIKIKSYFYKTLKFILFQNMGAKGYLYLKKENKTHNKKVVFPIMIVNLTPISLIL